MLKAWQYGIIAAVAGLAAIFALITLGATETPAAAQQVVLEANDERGPLPFFVGETVTVTTVAPVLNVQFGVGITVVGGTEPGLYGGTGEQTCDRQLLIDFLELEDAKGRAWADAMDIEVTQIAQFISGLTPVVLQVDTLVTNHGFDPASQQATPRQSILQAGTAVLIDEFGVPRAKCICGNPLGEPRSTRLAADVEFVGEGWEDFDPDETVAVTAGDDAVEAFDLADLDGDGTSRVRRPVGTDGADDQIMAGPDFTRRRQVIDVTLPSSLPLTTGTVPLSPRSTSGQIVAVTASSACRISGNQTELILTDVGECIIEFAVIGDEQWAPASEQFVIEVGRTPQELTFPPVGGIAVGDPPVPLGTVATSGNEVEYSTDGPCRVENGAVIAEAEGVCIVTASQPGGDGWEAAEPVTVRIELLPERETSREPQSIRLEVDSTVVFGQGPVQVTAAATSGLRVAVSVNGPCSLAGTELILDGAGVCTVVASQAGNGDFEPAAPRRVDVDVAKRPQAIDLSGLPSEVVRGETDATVALPRESSVGLPVRYEVSGSCELASAASLHLTAEGICDIRATQVGDLNHEAAPAAVAAITVTQTIEPRLLNEIVVLVPDLSCSASHDRSDGACGPSVAVEASATSGLDVTLTASGDCRITGTTHAQPLRSGDCILYANEPGDDRYEPAEEVTVSTRIRPLTQQITFDRPVDIAIHESTTLTATATSGGEVWFSTTGGCEVFGTSLEGVAAGPCTVTAHQGGNDVWAAAPGVSQTVEVGRRQQTIEVSSVPPSLEITARAEIVVSATSQLGVTVSSTAECSVTSSTVVAVAAGTCTLTFEQDGNADYEPAEPARREVNIVRRVPTVDLSAIPRTVSGDSSIELTASTTSDLDLEFDAVGEGERGCFIEHSSVPLLITGEPGVCILTISHAGNDVWTSLVEQIHITVTPPRHRLNIIATRPDLASMILVGPETCSGSCSFEFDQGSYVVIAARSRRGAEVLNFGGGSCYDEDPAQPGTATCGLDILGDVDIIVEFAPLPSQAPSLFGGTVLSVSRIGGPDPSGAEACQASNPSWTMWVETLASYEDVNGDADESDGAQLVASLSGGFTFTPSGGINGEGFSSTVQANMCLTGNVDTVWLELIDGAGNSSGLLRIDIP